MCAAADSLRCRWFSVCVHGAAGIQCVLSGAALILVCLSVFWIALLQCSPVAFPSGVKRRATRPQATRVQTGLCTRAQTQSKRSCPRVVLERRRSVPKGCSSQQEVKQRSHNMRMPGIESGSQAREACMIPLHYMRSGLELSSLLARPHPRCGRIYCIGVISQLFVPFLIVPVALKWDTAWFCTRNSFSHSGPRVWSPCQKQHKPHKGNNRCS